MVLVSKWNKVRKLPFMRYKNFCSWSPFSLSLSLSLFLYIYIRLTQFTGNQLQISSVVEEDTGSYQCYAINDAGRSFSATYVQVQSKHSKLLNFLTQLV